MPQRGGDVLAVGPRVHHPTGLGDQRHRGTVAPLVREPQRGDLADANVLEDHHARAVTLGTDRPDETLARDQDRRLADARRIDVADDDVDDTPLRREPQKTELARHTVEQVQVPALGVVLLVGLPGAATCAIGHLGRHDRIAPVLEDGLADRRVVERHQFQMEPAALFVIDAIADPEVGDLLRRASEEARRLGAGTTAADAGGEHEGRDERRNQIEKAHVSLLLEFSMNSPRTCEEISTQNYARERFVQIPPNICIIAYQYNIVNIKARVPLGVPAQVSAPVGTLLFFTIRLDEGRQRPSVACPWATAHRRLVHASPSGATRCRILHGLRCASHHP